jgi:hypothetical protein
VGGGGARRGGGGGGGGAAAAAAARARAARSTGPPGMYPCCARCRSSAAAMPASRMVAWQLLLTAAFTAGVSATTSTLLHVFWIPTTSDDCSLDRRRIIYTPLLSTTSRRHDAQILFVEDDTIAVDDCTAFVLLTPPGSRLKTDELVSGAPDRRLLPLLKEISDWIIRINVGSNDLYSPGPGGGCKSFFCSRYPSYIFINGNLARVLLAAHSITGNQSYLDEGLRWCDSFVRLKNTITTSVASPLGTGSNKTTGAWWNSGYDTIFFGDTGTAHQALALCAIKLPLGNVRRAHYILAMRQYAAFVQGGCVQHDDEVTEVQPSVADFPTTANIMRHLGLSEAAIQAAFSVDRPAGAPTARDSTTSPISTYMHASNLNANYPCPGGILNCPAKGGWIAASGAVGDGWVEGVLTQKPYSCSTATTGAGSFGALSAVLRGALDCDGPGTNCSVEAKVAKDVSFRAATWLASTVNDSGAVLNYNWDGSTSVSGMGGVAYIADGICQANLLGLDSITSAMKLMTLDVARKITDRAWVTDGRSPRVATLLQWHERNFPSDQSVKAALAKFVSFITSRQARFSPTTGSCAVSRGGGFCLMNNTITTGMVGLAVADLLQFNSTFAWGLPPPV